MKKKYYKVTNKELESWLIVEPCDVHNAIDGAMDGAPLGNELKIELIEMEETEFKKLPEIDFD